MALNAVIAKNFKASVAADARLTARLSDVHYGRADTSAVRPFAAFTVEEKEREYDSGGGALVQYELSLTVYGKQRARDVGVILQAFASLMNRSTGGPLTGTDLGTVISTLPTGSTLTEDDTEEFGKDVMVGRATWLIVVNEYEA